MCRGRPERRRREGRGAEDAEWGWGFGRGVLPRPSRGSGSLVSSPSGVQGRAPAANAFSAYSRYQNVSRGKKKSFAVKFGNTNYWSNTYFWSLDKSIFWSTLERREFPLHKAQSKLRRKIVVAVRCRWMDAKVGTATSINKNELK